MQYASSARFVSGSYSALNQVELRRWSHDHRVLEMVLRNGRRK